MIPERSNTTKDYALEQCLSGEELLIHRQKMLSDSLNDILFVLRSIWEFADSGDEYAKGALKASITIINSVITDDNTLGFSWYLMHIHRRLAEISAANGDRETAVEELKLYKEYSNINDEVISSGKQYYTCLLLDHHFVDNSAYRSYGSNIDIYYEDLKKPIYDDLRDMEAFKTL